MLRTLPRGETDLVLPIKQNTNPMNYERTFWLISIGNVANVAAKRARGDYDHPLQPERRLPSIVG
jgi:hypothetical protein